jgi:putative GTP pyrophosphokinase
MINEQLLDEYDRIVGLYRELAPSLRAHVQRLLGGRDSQILSVAERVKSRESLMGKIARPERTYPSLAAVTDILGIRVITYFEDSIDDIAQLIETEFKVDLKNSIDKRTLAEPTHFGYRSLHYICEIPPSYIGSLEGDLPWCFEIQIRTVLQHAWAEMEHDLGYKSQESVPAQVRRRLSRIASLLEICDEEFVEIRRFLDKYQADMKQRISRSASQVPIDEVSLSYYVRSPRPAGVDAKIAELLGKELDQQLFYPDYLVKMLHCVGLTTIDELDQSLALHVDEILASVVPYFNFTRETWQFSGQDIERCLRGYSLLFLAHIVVLERSALEITQIEQATRFYMVLDYPKDEAMARQVAERLVEIFRKFRQPRGTSNRARG